MAKNFLTELALRPRTRSREILVDPALLEATVAAFTDEPESVGKRLNLRPLPLAQVLRNVDALHAACNGHHVCGLPAHLQRFDLRDYLAHLRAA